MNGQDINSLREYMETEVKIAKVSRYKYQINDRTVDFSPAIPTHAYRNVPIWIARNLGLLKMAKHQVLPAIRESLRHYNEAVWLLYPLATSLSLFEDMMTPF